MCHSRSWGPRLISVVVSCLLSTIVFSQDLTLPADYSIDLQLAEVGRSHIMAGNAEITGTAANETGDEVFHRLISAGLDQPFPWKLTLVNNGIVNASSTAGGKVYVHGGMVSLLGQNKGLWAAVLSHEAAHTARRHQVRVYLREVYNQRMIAYYRARAAAGDKNANWSLIAFVTASKIALKKLERDQEHDADQQGMFLMARAGYHPDYVFALHHLLLMRTGEQSRFSAFFSDHPRWETRDQRSDRVYSDALAEFNRLWPDPVSSPGGSAPVVAFMGQPEAKENKATRTADISVPVFCRNSDQPVEVILAFEKDNHPVKAADSELSDKDGNLTFHDRADCLEKNETIPIVLHLPASAVSGHDRSLKGTAYVESQGNLIASSKLFDIHFPAATRAPLIHEASVRPEPVSPASPEIARANSQSVMTQAAIAPAQAESQKAKQPPNNEHEGTLTITASKAGADIFVDSTGRGKAPMSITLEPGKHSVQVVLDRYQDWVQEITVEAGKTASVTANLRPLSLAETLTARKFVPNPNSKVMELYVESPGSSVQQQYASSQTKKENKPLPAADSSGSDSGGWIGVTGITGAYGIIITDLAADSPARVAGLKIGDTIIAIDETSVKTAPMMDTIANSRAPGSQMKMSFVRNGIASETIVTVQKRH